MTPRVAVLVPVFEQAAFLPRALGSLVAGIEADWECVVVDDGSSDGPTVPADPRITLLRHLANRGLGAALNTGLAATTAPVVAYLPADDLWDPGHLPALLAVLADPGVDLACSGVRWSGGETTGGPDGFGRQLVQVAHRRTLRCWPEREELDSDDLELLLWHRAARPAATGVVTCTWTDHPGQRWRAIRERADGGPEVYRRTYRVQTPLRLHSTDSGRHDEPARYAGLPRTPPPSGDLRVLLVGELGFNPERLLALEARGVRMWGLWTSDNLGSQAVGPLPFGHVQDVEDLHAARHLDVDVVHAQLSWRAVPLARRALEALPHLPFVFSFKEAPQACVRSGTWPDLAQLLTRSDAVLLATEQERDWCLLALPGRLDPSRLGVLDGDLPLAHWFAGERSGRLSAGDGEVHTVALGRPIGIDGALLVALGRQGIHVHLHGPVHDRGPAAGWAREVAAAQAEVSTVHVHPKVEPTDWVPLLSRYDAGWLHRVPSGNGGDLRRATWDDLNAPARLPTLAAAGLPVLVADSPGSTVAVRRLAGAAGVPYAGTGELVARLQDGPQLAAAAEASWAGRHRFAFDTHADRLVALFRQVAGRGE